MLDNNLVCLFIWELLLFSCLQNLEAEKYAQRRNSLFYLNLVVHKNLFFWVRSFPLSICKSIVDRP